MIMLTAAQESGIIGSRLRTSLKPLKHHITIVMKGGPPICRDTLVSLTAEIKISSMEFFQIESKM